MSRSALITASSAENGSRSETSAEPLAEGLPTPAEQAEMAAAALRAAYLDTMQGRMLPAADALLKEFPGGLPTPSQGMALNRLRDTTGQLAEAVLSRKPEEARRLSGLLVYWATEVLEALS